MKRISTAIAVGAVFLAVLLLVIPCQSETKEQQAAPPSFAADNRPTFEVEAGKLGIVGVHFQSGRAEIDERYVEQLHQIANALNSEKLHSAKILIRGYSDSRGTAEQNLLLSRHRAQNAMELLVNRFGIDKNRLSYEGAGEADPVASNETASGRLLNRRIEFIYLGEMNPEKQ